MNKNLTGSKAQTFSLCSLYLLATVYYVIMTLPVNYVPRVYFFVTMVCNISLVNTWSPTLWQNNIANHGQTWLAMKNCHGGIALVTRCCLVPGPKLDCYITQFQAAYMTSLGVLCLMPALDVNMFVRL